MSIEHSRPDQTDLEPDTDTQVLEAHSDLGEGVEDGDRGRIAGPDSA
jgi:hypothetical protein